MTQIWNDKDEMVAVTKIKCVPNKVLGLRTEEKDRYRAVILTDGKKVREFKKFNEEVKPGTEIKADSFSAGDKLKVTGTSIGKGFQGVVKRHNFSGGGKTHGHRHDLRQPGSIGCAFPEHVLKGKKMAGRMGGEKVSVKNLKVMGVEGEVLLVKGAVPGKRGSLLRIEKI